MSLFDRDFGKGDVALIVAVVTIAIFDVMIIDMYRNAELDIKVDGEIDANTFIIVFLALTNSVVVYLGIRQKDQNMEKLVAKLIDNLPNNGDSTKDGP